MKTHHQSIRVLRKRRLQWVVLMLVMAALIYTGYWLYRRDWIVSHNAFVTGNLIPVEADATGIVTHVLAEESQFVKKGDLLVRLDEHRAQTALKQTEGELGQAVREIGALFATHRQMCQKLISRDS
jgi:membrane fusion protein (multidrug efflux system)